jgi:hypothetical protein
LALTRVTVTSRMVDHMGGGEVQVEGLSLDLELIGELGRRAAHPRQDLPPEAPEQDRAPLLNQERGSVLLRRLRQLEVSGRCL